MSSRGRAGTGHAHDLPRHPPTPAGWPWWRIAEPSTVLTDALLAALGVLLAVRVALLPASGTTVALAAALLATALCAASGGAVHGLVHQLGPRGWLLLWRLTLLLAGLANALLVTVVVLGQLPGAAHRPLLALVGAKLVAFAVTAWRDYRFRHVVIDAAFALLFVAVAQLWAWWRLGAPSAPWLLAAVGVSVAGGLLQQRRVGLHRHFNHNDVYHLTQAGALYLFYRGGVLLAG